ncbi:hypothetical protein UFOVP1290_538 [uncultured Caudovirales phage]|uniref:Uncharacterized protein n=1 Tax=uncultured Caudovirales phage TaxID=2100421 RepID=A0A6J5RTW0_9CAUD|nr:hypothetical protein UFOVP1290_538 [uncultured Caudovirales phage]
MKKPKVVKKYYFKDMTNSDMVELLDKELPINMKYNEDLIDRICNRYPLLDKKQISIIVKSVFQSFRDLLFFGKVLNFNNLFFDTKLLVFAHRRGGHIFPSLKVKMSTPPPLR